MSLIDHDDNRIRTLEAFANNEQAPSNHLPATAPQFSPPVDRIHGAQRVAVKRDEVEVMKKIRTLAAAAGEYFYYRFPVSNKGKKEYIEGPTIKCANAVARLFGNCDVDCRSEDLGTHWLFHARFMDLETGFSLTRPLQQRKSQATVRGDAGRAEDIAFQIGASKALRNVVTNALDTFTTFAWQEAKLSIIETVGKNLERYKLKVAQRLEELDVHIHRVEAVRGRPLKDWLAADVARTIAEIQAINDGMATAEETFPTKNEQQAAEGDGKLDQFANTNNGSGESTTGTADASAQKGPAGAGAAAETTEKKESQPDATTSPTASAVTEGAGDGDDGSSETSSNAPAPSKANDASGEVTIKTDAEYRAYAGNWIEETPSRDARMARWSREKAMRNKANVTPETRDFLDNLVKKKD